MRRNSSRASASAVRGVVAAVAASVVALTSLASGVAVVPPVRGQALAAEVTTAADWTLLYAEDFSTPLDEAGAQWGVGARLLSRAPVGNRRSAGLVDGPRRTISP